MPCTPRPRPCHRETYLDCRGELDLNLVALCPHVIDHEPAARVSLEDCRAIGGRHGHARALRPSRHPEEYGEESRGTDVHDPDKARTFLLAAYLVGKRLAIAV
jgi:hypothetical protein